ncbi:MAG: DUF502 domain-containing protein [Parvibaculaceae bacterium]
MDACTNAAGHAQKGMTLSQNTSDEPKKLAPVTSSSFAGKLRTYFLTGIVVTAPIAITLWASYWFVTLFDAWLRPLIPAVLDPFNYLPFRIPGIGLVFALLGITLIGALAANLVGRTILTFWDRLLNRTPVVRSVYKGTKQIFETLFSQSGASFRSVGLIEWPRKGIYSLVFVSREVDGGQVGLEPGRSMYAVYISTTPNPTSGYVYFVDVGDVRIIDMPVEDAAKLVISMGLVFPENDEPVKMIPARANIDQDVAQELLEMQAPAGADADEDVGEKPVKKRQARRRKAPKTEAAAK